MQSVRHDEDLWRLRQQGPSAQGQFAVQGLRAEVLLEGRQPLRGVDLENPLVDEVNIAARYLQAVQVQVYQSRQMTERTSGRSPVTAKGAARGWSKQKSTAGSRPSLP